MSIIKTQISQDELEIGRWYVGRGRNANVALWDGKYFLTVAEKGGRSVVKKEPYFQEEYGCFQPFMAIDEGVDPDRNPQNWLDANRLRYAVALSFGTDAL